MLLQEPQGDGAPLRTHLKRLQASTGRIDPLLAQSMKPLPAAVADLWQAFVSLSGTRLAGEALQPITCTEIESWQRLQGVTLSPWEADTLLAMDRALRSAPRQQRKDLTQ